MSFHVLCIVCLVPYYLGKFKLIELKESENSRPVEAGSNYMDYEVGYDDYSQYYGHNEGNEPINKTQNHGDYSSRCGPQSEQCSDTCGGRCTNFHDCVGLTVGGVPNG